VVVDADVDGGLDAVVVVSGTFDHPGVAAVATFGVEVPPGSDLGFDLREGGRAALRGKRPPGQRPGGG
jgi:hypothetical protein